MYYANVREEELKNKVGKDYFGNFDTTKIVGNVDFCVTFSHQGKQEFLFEDDTRSLLWAEAKRGNADIYKSIVQLILTIGKARTFDKELPPAFLGAFDAEKIAFIPYSNIQEVFYQNDFNWNVTPSNHETKEFKQIHEKVRNSIENNSLLFNFETDENELKLFIKTNFVVGKSGLSKIQVDKNNFISIYSKWLQKVKPSIAISNWELAKKDGIFDLDFYLADLLSENNKTIKDNLYILDENKYKYDSTSNKYGGKSYSEVSFNDNQKAHAEFWNKYERPPKPEYSDYIVERRDLLVPQDVRERKGSFFTPQIWVEKSQEYLTDVLGENWQDEYYIWDCAAGTGNLLTGLTNKYNIYASTLDKQDVDVMHQRIETMNQNSVSGHGANLLPDHVFQFDFLNDNFEDAKVPKSLQDILKDPEKRKKLVIYINPPYAEAATADRQGNKKDVSTNKVKNDYSAMIGSAVNELFAQFFIRAEKEISGCYLSSFSKLKYIQGPNFIKFRRHFLAEFKKGFVVQADTFDNVKGKFPIGFLIWDLSKNLVVKDVQVNVYQRNGDFIDTKMFVAVDKKFINSWYSKFYHNHGEQIGVMNTRGNDFQNYNYIYISSENNFNHTNIVTANNLIPTSIYLSVRHVFEATWLNDRDQFLYPNDGWKTDVEFQNNCLAFALFNGQNRISSKQGTNHWIPFTENEVNARERFESNFMTNFISGKLGGNVVKISDTGELFENYHGFIPTIHLHFSVEAAAVFEAGRELWRYYHQKHGDAMVASTVYNANASLYDIREYFQGRNQAGKMNNKSLDEEYNKLIGNLRGSLKLLALKIQPKVYEYGFLRG